MFRKLFRPAYQGALVTVHPKRWWSPRDRKDAKVAVKLGDYHAAEIRSEALRQMRDRGDYTRDWPTTPAERRRGFLDLYERWFS